MEMENFEKQLKEMSKPDVSELKHQNMLENAILHAKDKSVLSWWWLSIPLYLMAALVMKTFFMPGSGIISNIHEVTSKRDFPSLLFFLLVPLTIILANIVSIKRIHYLTGSPKTTKFFQLVWPNVLMIVLSLIILIIYLL